MMFFISRAFVEVLAPLNFCIILFIITLICILVKRTKTGVALLSIGIFVLLISGYGVGSIETITAKESLYPALNKENVEAFKQKHIKFIVVLGSGHVSDERFPANSQIGGTSLFRLIEGMRLLNQFPDAKLVISGGVGHDPIPNADIVAQVAKSIGLASENILIENRPLDTLQEAELLFPLLGKNDFILVTSALHMQRAMSIFINNGMHPIAAPTDYIVKIHAQKSPESYFPTTRNLDITKNIIYEWIGTLWMKIKRSLENYL